MKLILCFLSLFVATVVGYQVSNQLITENPTRDSDNARCDLRTNDATFCYKNQPNVTPISPLPNTMHYVARLHCPVTCLKKQLKYVNTDGSVNYTKAANWLKPRDCTQDRVGRNGASYTPMCQRISNKNDLFCRKTIGCFMCPKTCNTKIPSICFCSAFD